MKWLGFTMLTFESYVTNFHGTHFLRDEKAWNTIKLVQ